MARTVGQNKQGPFSEALATSFSIPTETIHTTLLYADMVKSRYTYFYALESAKTRGQS